MSDLKIFKLSEDDFNKMLAEKSFQVRQLGFEPGPTEKVRLKTGERKIVTYEDGEVGGIKVPNYKAHVSYEEVFRDQEIKTRIVLFQALGHRTEVAIEKYLGFA